MDKISEVDEVENTQDEARDSEEHEDIPVKPDYQILQTNLELKQKSEQHMKDEVKELQQKLKSSTSGYELKIKSMADQIEVLKTENEKLNRTNNDDLNELRDSLTQKDRKIRHLNTSVTLLKNFLFFFKSKAIKGLKVANEEVKKEIDIVREKYFKELDESKDKIIDQINKSTSAIPSEALQNTLKHTKEEFEKFRLENKEKMEKIQQEHMSQIDQLNKVFEDERSSLLNKHAQDLENLKAEYESQQSSSTSDFTGKEVKYKDQIDQLNVKLQQEKSSLDKANYKIEALNTTIGRLQSSDELHKQSLEQKDKEISDLKGQISELIGSVKSLRDQSDDEIRSRLISLENEVKEYKQRLQSQEQRHEDALKTVQEKHEIELKTLREAQNSTSTLDAAQRESFNKLLIEKDELYNSSRANFESILSNKDEMITSLHVALDTLKKDHNIKQQEVIELHKEQQKMVERIKEEIQSVLSLKTAYSDEAKIASKEEFNDNVRIINEFFTNPYDKTLKKVFKLKRLRKDDSSVDSNDLLKKGRHDEDDEHETELQEQQFQKLKEKHVNDGRVEDMAMRGNRALPPRSRGRGAPPPRARGNANVMPPRHNARAGMQATQSSGLNASRQNRQITIMDPSKNILRKQENSPVDSLTGGITTPPSRKRSIGNKESPRSAAKTTPFSIENVKQEQEAKKEQEAKEEEEEYEVEYEEEEEEDENEGEEEEKVNEKEQNAKADQAVPKPPQRPQPVKQNVRPPPPSKTVQRPQPRPKPATDAAAPNISRITAQRDAPPMKPRKDSNPSKPESTKTPFQAPPPAKVPEKKTNEDRSKTPQPIKSENQAARMASRTPRHTRETEEPPVTHAVARDKSIGERLRSTLLPGFLGGGSKSTVAVRKASQRRKEETKKEKQEKKESPDAKKPKQDKQEEESSAFGLFDRVLGLLGKRKTQAKQAFMGKSGSGMVWDEKKKKYKFPGDSESEEDDLPPPPIVAKKKVEEGKEVSGKPKPTTTKAKKQNILANRYASTFETMQMDVPEEDSLKQEAAPFRPPSFDADPFSQPPQFDQPVPEKSDSPKNRDMHYEKMTEEGNMMNLRKDVSDLSQLKTQEKQEANQMPGVKSAVSYDEEVEFDPEDSYGRDSDQPNNQDSNDSQLEEVVSDMNRNYEKAYNQLLHYKKENKKLKQDIARNQTTAELNIDYFVQLCEDVKYRGLEEIETYKNEIKILKSEQNKFIQKQADCIFKLNMLENENKTLKAMKQEPISNKPYRSAEEAKIGLRAGLDELRDLHKIVEKVHQDQLKIKQKDQAIGHIIQELLDNVDSESEQGKLLRQNLEGEYDINTICSVIQDIFEENAKQLTKINRQVESNFASQLAKMSQDSRYKEERINELIREGLDRARAEEDQTKEYMMLQKQAEEKDERIQELEEELKAAHQSQKNIERQYQTRFQEILDESQSERDEWMKSGTLTAEESTSLKAEIDQLKEENAQLLDELEQSNVSYRVMEAEYTKHDEDNNAMRHTIQILEKEVSHRNELLEQYEQGNDNIIEEYQDKVKQLIDDKIDAEQKYDDLYTKFVNICDYLKDIHSTVKSGECIDAEDEAERSFDTHMATLTEDEMEEMYETILTLYENKRQQMEAQYDELELKLEEANLALENKESELLDLQINSNQASSNDDDESKRKAIRNMKEKLDEANNELKNKNRQIQQLNDELQEKLDRISDLEVDIDEMKEQFEQQQEESGNAEQLKKEIAELEDERDELHSELLESQNKLNRIERERNDEIFNLKSQISEIEHEKSELQHKINTLNNQILESTTKSSKSAEDLKDQLHAQKIDYEKQLSLQEKEFAKELKDKESTISTLTSKIASLESELQSLTESQKDSSSQHTSEANKLQATITSLNDQLAEKDAEILTLKESLESSSTSHSSLHSTLNTKLSEALEVKSSLESDITNLKQELKTQSKKYLEQLEKVKNEWEGKQEEVKRDTEQMLTAEHKEKEKLWMKQTQDVVDKLKDKLSKQKDKTKHTEGLLKQTADKLDNVLKEQSEKSYGEEELQRVKQEASTESNLLNSKINKLTNQIKEKEADIGKFKEENEALKKEIHDRIKEFDEKEADLNGRLDAANGKVGELEKQISDLQTKHDELNETIKQLTDQNELFKTTFAEIASEAELESPQLDSKESILKLQEELNSKMIAKFEQEQSQIKSDLESKTAEYNNASEKVKDLEAKLEEEKREREILNETLKKRADGVLEKKLKTLSEEKDTMKRNLENIIEILSKDKTGLEKEVRDFRKLKEELRKRQEEAEEEPEEKPSSFFGLF